MIMACLRGGNYSLLRKELPMYLLYLCIKKKSENISCINHDSPITCVLYILFYLVYSNVDLSIRVSPLPLANKDSDSDDKDDDFMYVDNIKKYTMKRSTQVKLNTK
jgi:hypothetical protein